MGGKGNIHTAPLLNYILRSRNYFPRAYNGNYVNCEPISHTNENHFFPGAAAAAVMSSSKVTTVLRPTSQLPNAATAQPAVQHIIHQPIQARQVVGSQLASIRCLL